MHMSAPVFACADVSLCVCTSKFVYEFTTGKYVRI